MKYSKIFKLWHWLHALVVLGLLGTVFLRKTFLSWRTNSEILMQKLADYELVVTTEQAKELAKAVRAGMWEWHILLGYALAVLLVCRVYLFLKPGVQKENFSSLSMHKKLVELAYYMFYAAIFVMALSGFSMVYHEALLIDKELHNAIKEFHEYLFRGILFFVGVHIIGVLYAELTKEKGIISNMISTKTDN